MFDDTSRFTPPYTSSPGSHFSNSDAIPHPHQLAYLRSSSPSQVGLLKTAHSWANAGVLE